MGTYSLVTTKTGDNTLIFKDGDKSIRLHSAYNPRQEAIRCTKDFQPGRASIILVSGLGFGYHIEELKKLFPGLTLIILEHDEEVISIMVKERPQIIEQTHIINNPLQLSAFFEEIDISHFSGIAHYIHRPSYQMYQEFYESLVSEIKQYVTSKISDLLTRFEFEIQWIENILHNLHKITDAKPVINLFGKFKNIPGIIVSAGPSLRKNVSFLKQLKKKALIICVDTAAKVLLRHGITPHIVMTLDAQKHSIRHFLGLPAHNFLLLADLVSYPPVTRNHNGPVILSTTSKYYTNTAGEHIRETTPIMDWIEQYIEPLGDIQSGGSVATSAFDLLLNLGCSKIILVGQDLAYTGREIHSTGTHHNENWLTMYSRIRNLETINQNVIRKRKIKYVTSFGDQEPVISDFVFDLYRSWFEDSITKVSVPVINATDGGARIQHAEEIPLTQLASSLPDTSPEPGDIIQSLLDINTSHDNGRLIAALQNAKHIFNNIKEQIVSINNNTTPETLGQIIQTIEDNGLKLLINPFLRKSETYITRHNIEMEKATTILLGDILRAVQKLVPLFDKCLQKISQ